MKTRKITNNCIITRFHTFDHGDSLTFQLNVSSLSESRCCVLSDIPIEELHHFLLADHNLLLNFCKANSTLTLSISSGNSELAFEVDKSLSSKNYADKRFHCPILLAVISDSVGIDEQILVACHIIHVGLEGGQPDTTILHTFWKTNWNRLLTPQVLYAARGDGEPIEGNGLISSNSSGRSPWKPCCLICLSPVEGWLHVFLPCRHAGLCTNCFRSFNRRKYPITPNDLCCPICRSLVVCSLHLLFEGGIR
ncbi:unnamed protein product [Dicrocoelium dendriticum]|nr:unnamed protein product [Dicrocoelium dendriticum]